ASSYQDKCFSGSPVGRRPLKLPATPMAAQIRMDQSRHLAQYSEELIVSRSRHRVDANHAKSLRRRRTTTMIIVTPIATEINPIKKATQSLLVMASPYQGPNCCYECDVSARQLFATRVAVILRQPMSLCAYNAA